MEDLKEIKADKGDFYVLIDEYIRRLDELEKIVGVITDAVILIRDFREPEEAPDQKVKEEGIIGSLDWLNYRFGCLNKSLDETRSALQRYTQ